MKINEGNEMALIRPLLGKLLSNIQDNHESKAIDLYASGKDEEAYKLMHFGIPADMAKDFAVLSQAAAKNRPEDLQLWHCFSRFFFRVIWYKLNAWLEKPFLNF
jgi:hypothetical protein